MNETLQIPIDEAVSMILAHGLTGVAIQQLCDCKKETRDTHLRMMQLSFTASLALSCAFDAWDGGDNSKLLDYWKVNN